MDSDAEGLFCFVFVCLLIFSFFFFFLFFVQPDSQTRRKSEDEEGSSVEEEDRSVFQRVALETALFFANVFIFIFIFFFLVLLLLRSRSCATVVWEEVCQKSWAKTWPAAWPFPARCWHSAPIGAWSTFSIIQATKSRHLSLILLKSTKFASMTRESSWLLALTMERCAKNQKQRSVVFFFFFFFFF